MLDPLVGLGPLRFGMSPPEVREALGGAVPVITQGREGAERWQRYSEEGVTAVYGPGPRLVAVAVDGMTGPMVRLRDVELIDRVPSEARADLLAFAARQGAAARVNWSGDVEVAAWGVSMGATQEQVLSSEGYLRRGDRVRTEALFVSSELADDPYGTEPVIAWRDVRDENVNPGAWPVRALEDRPSWGWIPLQSVGPLRFGMTPQQVAAALDGEVPAARRGHFPWPVYGESGQWYVTEDQFDGAGVTAHYWYEEGIPALGAVTVHGRTGPQLAFDGLDLIGGTVSEIDAALERRSENDEFGLVVGCGGDLGPDGLGMYVRAARAGDTMISEARFCAEEWEDHG